MHLHPKSSRLSFKVLGPNELETLYSLVKDDHLRKFLMEEQEMSKEECDDLVRKGEILRRHTGLGLYLVSHNNEAIGYCGFMETHPPSSEALATEILIIF